MKAVTWHGKRDVRVESVPDPKIEQPTDAMSKSPRRTFAGPICTCTRFSGHS